MVLWGRRILAPVREGGPGLTWVAEKEATAAGLWRGQPQLERRGHCSPQAAAPSEPARRRPLRSYTRRHASTRRHPAGPRPLSLPPGAGRAGEEPAPTGSLRLGADGEGPAKGAL